MAGARLVAARSFGPLGLRVATGLVLVAVALGSVWLGQSVFSALVAAGALVMFAEWAVMHRLGRGLRFAGLVLLASVIVLMSLVSIGEVVMVLGAGAGVLAVFGVGREARLWTAAGILYCGLPAVALIWVRGLSLGLEAVVFLLLCVWTTDVFAFFAGRAIGGPRLAPRISPAKTWAGAFGGIVGAMLVAGGAAAVWLATVGGQRAGVFVALAGSFAVLAIMGDLAESAMKRRARVKDSGSLLPGHGGVLDRLDGLVPVAIAGAGVFAVTGWAG